MSIGDSRSCTRRQVQRPRSWHFRDEGAGRPLILLHGIGMSLRAWGAVTPYLRANRRVISFDIAGFGRTPPLPHGTPPTVGNLVDALADALSELGFSSPIDFAGNSLGGIMALEAARRGIARSAVAISPAGLWERQPPAHVTCIFGAMRAMSTHVPGALKAALGVAWFREMVLALPLSVGSRRMSATDACQAVDDLRQSTAFESTFESTRLAFCGRGIAVPTTVVFGERDWIFPAWSRRRNAVPTHVRWLTKPGWGHVPLWVDPAGVANLILDATR